MPVMFACTEQLNLYVPGAAGAVNVALSPCFSSGVLNLPSSETASCAATSMLVTLMVAPALTVSGSPKAKFWMVMVPESARALVLPSPPAGALVVGAAAALVVVATLGAAELDESAPEPQAATAMATAAAAAASRSSRFMTPITTPSPVRFTEPGGRPRRSYYRAGEVGGRVSADEQVLRLLHDEHAPALWGYAMRLTGGDAGRAQDAVQETLLRAWRHPEVMDSERGSPRPWLFTTLRNVLIDEWRARKVRPEVVTDEVPELATPDHADAAVQSWLVADALRQLSQQHREVLLECYYRGCSVAQAAQRLGIPAGTVKSRTYYALRALRLALEERGVTA